MGALNLMELNMGPTKVKCITAEKESVQKQDTVLQRELNNMTLLNMHKLIYHHKVKISWQIHYMIHKRIYKIYKWMCHVKGLLSQIVIWLSRVADWRTVRSSHPILGSSGLLISMVWRGPFRFTTCRVMTGFSSPAWTGCENHGKTNVNY